MAQVPVDVFGASTRPDEDVTAGLDEPPNRFVAPDPDAQLKALWAETDNPELRALIQRAPRP